MAKTYFVRLEARTTASDLDAGISARVYDPAWMLGRQWQIGELLGEDAGSPVLVTLDAEAAMVSRYRGANDKRFETFDPAQSPLEPLVECESWQQRKVWTARQRIDAGRAFVRALADANLSEYAAAFRRADRLDPADAELRSADPAGARLLDVSAGRIPDGHKLFQRLARNVRAGGAVPATDEVDADPDQLKQAVVAWLSWCDSTLADGGGADAWRSDALDYAFELSTGAGGGQTTLAADGYRGGSLEWHAFDVQAGAQPGGFARQPRLSVLPTGVQFRGMPNARWWEFEDATVDFGSVDAGASDVARLAFLEFALVYGNDFFAVPLRLPIGSLTRITSLVVNDTFGMPLSIASANRRQGKQGARRFSLFALHERDPRSPGGDAVADLLFLAPVASQLLATKPVEDVLLLRDEMANLAWAVERRYEGERGVAVERHETDVLSRPDAVVPSRRAVLRYELGNEVPPYWFPLVPTGLAGDILLELQRMTNQPASVRPLGRFLSIGGAAIPDAEVPREGTRLVRDYAMTRWSNGTTFVWSRRRREIGRGEGSSGLRFDVTDRASGE